MMAEKKQWERKFLYCVLDGPGPYIESATELSDDFFFYFNVEPKVPMVTGGHAYPNAPGTVS